MLTGAAGKPPPEPDAVRPDDGMKGRIRRASKPALLCCFCGLAMLSLYVAATGPVTIGMYDPERTFASDRSIGIEHIFVHWWPFQANVYRAAVRDAGARGRRLMVTIEPFTRSANGVDGASDLLSRIAAGEFDGLIKSICNEIGRSEAPVLVRWGHEMDDNSGRYPWANRRPADYVAAYRHFVDRCRTFAPEARFVWSPKGLSTLPAYYPGGDYVDFVGVTFFGLQAWEIDHFGKARSFTATLMRHYRQVSPYGKPVIVAEVGVAGDDAYRRRWLASMFIRHARFPKVTAVVYFNAREPFRWPRPYGWPDWRIDPPDLRHAGVPPEKIDGNELK